MNLIAPSSVLVAQLTAQLRGRQAELAMQLHAGVARQEASGEVVDFKDVAAEDTRAWVDDAAHAQAAHELEQIAGALRR